MQHFPTTISIRAILDETVVRELLLRFESPRLARSSAPSSKSSGCLSPLSARRGPFRKSSFFPRFSSASGVVSLRSKFRGPLFDVTKRSRSSNRAENAREAPFSPRFSASIDFETRADDVLDERVAISRLPARPSSFDSRSRPFFGKSSFFFEISHFRESFPLPKAIFRCRESFSAFAKSRNRFATPFSPLTSSRTARAILNSVGHLIYRSIVLGLPSRRSFLRFRNSNPSVRFNGSDVREF